MVAQQCRERHNFFTSFAVVSGLSSMPVSRLKRTWELLPTKIMDRWKQLEALCNPTRNMKAYRDSITKSQPPITPFIRKIVSN